MRALVSFRPRQIIAGCVPINLFGGAGSITQEQIDFMAVRLRDPGNNEQTLANFTMDGNWGRSWAGDLRWAFGLEYRHEAGGYEYDLVRSGGTVGTWPDRGYTASFV